VTCRAFLLQNLNSSAEEETFSDSILSLCHKLCFSLLFCSHHASNILEKSHSKRMICFSCGWNCIKDLSFNPNSYSNMQIMQKLETLASRVMYVRISKNVQLFFEK